MSFSILSRTKLKYKIQPADQSKGYSMGYSRVSYKILLNYKNLPITFLHIF